MSEVSTVVRQLSISADIQYIVKLIVETLITEKLIYFANVASTHIIDLSLEQTVCDLLFIDLILWLSRYYTKPSGRRNID
jgi:hypothetical protein